MASTKAIAEKSYNVTFLKLCHHFKALPPHDSPEFWARIQHGVVQDA
jgi:hypothetical protein